MVIMFPDKSYADVEDNYEENIFDTSCYGFVDIAHMSSYADQHQDKSIIFYLDMNVAPEKAENLDKFVAYLSETVERTEPGTTYYKYFISADRTKVSLLEVYQG